MSHLQSPSSPPDLPASQAIQPASQKRAKRAEGRFRFSKVFTRWWWIAVILVSAITYTVSQIPVWMDMRGPLYESTALLEVQPIADIDPTLSRSGGGMGSSMTRQFIHTQFEIIIAPATLEIALAKSDLLNRLGGDKTAAMERIKKSIRTSQRHGTDLIEISYRDEDGLLARDGVMAVYEAYKERRDDLEMSMRKDRLKAIKIELQSKIDRVKELRKRLMDVAEKVGLIYVETEDGGKTISDVTGLRNVAEKELSDAEGRMRELSFQLNKLLSVDDDDLISVASKLPDVGFKEAYKKYEDAIKEIETMKASGLAERHPDIQTRRKRVTELKKSLDKRAVNTRESLKHKLALVQGQVKNMRDVLNKEGDTARSMQELNVARKEYEMVRDSKDNMEVSYDLEKTKMAMPTNNIIVHQVPEQGRAPVTKGREFIIILGTVFSLPVSIGLAVILMYVAEAIFPRKA